jgi:hypothetical protein
MSSLHEPKNAWLDFQGLTHSRFMFAEQFKKEQAALHEPSSQTIGNQQNLR